MLLYHTKEVPLFKSMPCLNFNMIYYTVVIPLLSEYIFNFTLIITVDDIANVGKSYNRSPM